MSDITIQEVPSDAGDRIIVQCSRLLSEFADWHVLQCAPWQAPPARPRDIEFIRAILANPDEWLLVAYHAGYDNPHGIIHLSLHDVFDKPGWPNHTFGYIEAEWVTPQSRRRGIGKALIEAAKQHFRAREVDSIETNVWGWNTASQALHAALGFEVKNTNLVTWL